MGVCCVVLCCVSFFLFVCDNVSVVSSCLCTFWISEAAAAQTGKCMQTGGKVVTDFGCL